MTSALLDLEEAEAVAAEAEARAWRFFTPKPHLTLREWAERYRRWPNETPFRFDQTPHLIEIAEAYSDPDLEEMTIMKNSQAGATEGIGLNLIGYHMDQEPRSMLVVIPSVDEAEKWSKKKLQPMIDATPKLHGKLEEGSRQTSNTILEKAFPGGSLGIVGSNSGRGFRMVTIGVVFSDDVDGWDDTAGRGANNEGDQVTLIRRRTDRVVDRKLVWVSTPTMVNARIHTLYKRMERRGRFHVPCPHCGHMQVLRWGGRDTPYGIKWDQEEVDPDTYVLKDGEILHGRTVHRPDTAHYVCEAHGCVIEEADKADMVKRAAASKGGGYLTDSGEPVRVPGTRTLGFWFNALTITLPGSEWPRLVREFLEISDDTDALRAFYNLVLAEPWEDREHAELDAGNLEGRVERISAEVPDGVGILTAFVDVQVDRLELQVMGWGIREEAWVIAHHRIYGDPERPDVWQTLEALRTRPYRTQSGGTMRIATMMVDEGYLQQEVYKYVRGKEAAGVYASDGQGGKRDYVLKRSKRQNRHNVKPWKVAVDSFKDVLFRRLRIQQPGPGYIHFCKPATPPTRDIQISLGMDREYFEQFTRERRVYERMSGVLRSRYKQFGANEAVDLTVGCMAALHTIPGIVEQLPRLVEQARQSTTPTLARPARRIRSRGIR